MRDFSWKYFALTGDVVSYLLYREVERSKDSIDTDALGTGNDEEEHTVDSAQ